MFRFTIRDLLWLMVAVGLASGWWREYDRVVAYVRRDQLRENRQQVATQYGKGLSRFVELSRANVELDEAEIRAADTVEQRQQAEQLKAKHLDELKRALSNQ